MVLAPPRTLQNDVLQRLPARERKAVIADCEEVEVALGDTVYRRDARITHVYFPLDSMFSEVAPAQGTLVEAFLTGREGMVGFAVVLGTTRAPLDCAVQGGGRALRMPERKFSALVARSKPMRDLALATVRYQLLQTSRNVYCVRQHQIVERLARWLLMAADRHQSPRFFVTHKFLAAMLGTRRAGVTVAASALQLRRLIRYRRGEVEILDRKGLEAAACSCYPFSRDAARKAFGTKDR